MSKSFSFPSASSKHDVLKDSIQRTKHCYQGARILEVILFSCKDNQPYNYDDQRKIDEFKGTREYLKGEPYSVRESIDASKKSIYLFTQLQTRLNTGNPNDRTAPWPCTHDCYYYWSTRLWYSGTKVTYLKRHQYKWWSTLLISFFSYAAHARDVVLSSQINWRVTLKIFTSREFSKRCFLVLI